MRHFLDVEFNGFGGDFISLALVPEIDEWPVFYEAVVCPNPTFWVSRNVLPVLQTNPIPVENLSMALGRYLDDDLEPVLIADWPEDIYHAARLLSNKKGKRLVSKIVRFELLPVSDFSTELSSTVPHNAYYDALALRNHVLEQEAQLADKSGFR